jgi:hypothetical protein
MKGKFKTEGNIEPAKCQCSFMPYHVVAFVKLEIAFPVQIRQVVQNRDQ